VTRCSFCGAERAEVDWLIRGPALICDRCVLRADVASADGPAGTCSFCRAAGVGLRLRGDGVAICAPCVELCADILREARPAPPAATLVKR